MSTMTQSAVKLKPLGNRAVLKREEIETTQGGIILPDTAKKKQEIANVVAIGPGITDENGKQIPMPVKIGDRVLVEKYTGQEVTFEDEEFIIVKADEIIAIVEA